MTAEEIRVIITAQNREFNEALNGVINQIDDMDERTRDYESTASGVFRRLAQLASALGIGKIISDSVMNGGELEQNLGGVEVVFKQHADSMKNAAKTAFEDMGLSESAYLATANKMGALLKGSGFDTANAAGMSQKAMQRAADVASIMGIEVSSAMEAVTGMAKGNFTMMDNLGVAINDTTLQIYAQEKGLGKLETTQQKVNAAMQMFLEKTEYAAGNYARENDTFSGSLTTFKAELENLTADLGTQLLPAATAVISMARSGLEAVAPMVISLGDGINRIALFLANLSPTAKTMLTIALLSAVAIPAVTKAQLLYNAANRKWKDLLNILIPKEITRANVMKATVGWLSIIIGLLALVADIGAKAREMNSGEEMQDTADGADIAADSVDGLAESYAGLGDSADTAKKSLLDIDRLNVMSGSSSTGGIDFAAISDGALTATADVEDLKSAIDDLQSGTDLSNVLDISNTFSDLGTGFATIADAFNFDSETQLTSLRVLNEQVKGIFGEGWTDFWEHAGSDLYNILNGNDSEAYKALSDLNNHFKQNLGDFGETWSNNWTTYGQELYEIMNGDDSWYVKAIKVIGQTLDALFFGNDGFGRKWKDFWFEQGSRLERLINNTTPKTQEEKDEIVQMIISDIESKNTAALGTNNYAEKYTWANFMPPEVTAAPAYSSAELSDFMKNYGGYKGNGDEPTPVDINLTAYTELDGDIIGESNVRYNWREQMRSNGY